MSQITTEITSSQILSDNPIHQRLLYAYEVAKKYVSGHLLEVGCGEGRGLFTLFPYCKTYTALDKNKALLDILHQKYPNSTFIETLVPPFKGIEDNSFDTIVAFQVIEHIQKDDFFVSEIFRVLKPGGKLILTTPNIHLTLTRNPWHIREYTAKELEQLLASYFKKIDKKSIIGNKKVMDYYELNKKSVQKITRWDIFNLQHKLPASFLQLPYDILNRMNRNKMMKSDNSLVAEIALEDFSVSNNADEGFDLLFVAEK
jgi:ubiquinone/menaquinone biosynthesis C-methylase UbiE